jgi:translation initiation factor IF-1
VTRFVLSVGTASRLLVLALLVGAGLALFAPGRVAAVSKDDHGEVRVAGVCGSGTTSKLRLKGGDDGIELRFEVDHSRAGVVWRVVLVHERRIAWKGTARTIRPYGAFEVRRTLPDLLGTDAVTATAWGPHGLVCRAAATLPDS